MTAVSQYTAVVNTATAQISTTSGVFGKYACKTSSSGTLTLYDSSTSSTSDTKLLDAFPLTAGNVYHFDIAVAKGIYVVIGGTGNGSVLYV